MVRELGLSDASLAHGPGDIASLVETLLRGADRVGVHPGVGPSVAPPPTGPLGQPKALLAHESPVRHQDARVDRATRPVQLVGTGPRDGTGEDVRADHLQPSLCLDGATDGLVRDVAGRRCEVAPRPERRCLAEVGIPLPQFVRRDALDRLEHITYEDGFPPLRAPDEVGDDEVDAVFVASGFQMSRAYRLSTRSTSAQAQKGRVETRRRETRLTAPAEAGRLAAGSPGQISGGVGSHRRFLK